MYAKLVFISTFRVRQIYVYFLLQIVRGFLGWPTVQFVFTLVCWGLIIERSSEKVYWFLLKIVLLFPIKLVSFRHKWGYSVKILQSLFFPHCLSHHFLTSCTVKVTTSSCFWKNEKHNQFLTNYKFYQALISLTYFVYIPFYTKCNNLCEFKCFSKSKLKILIDTLSEEDIQ